MGYSWKISYIIGWVINLPLYFFMIATTVIMFLMMIFLIVVMIGTTIYIYFNRMIIEFIFVILVVFII
ncbi:hypothetical protein ACQGSX_14675, partial [Bacillus sp. GMs2/1]|uniref:hypothetical protein n=1 Tax=Bacillus sp. GMs2/1 TaxID=3418493 RepID=UPI003CEE3EE3